MEQACTLPYWLRVFGALLTPVIGAIALWIAYQQQSTNNLKLKHELFDKRFAVFQALKAFLGRIVREGKTSFEGCIDLLRDTNQAEFLFGPEVVAYIRSLYERGLELSRLHEQLYGDDERLPVGPERSAVSERQRNLLGLFLNEFDVARKIFGKYMRLESTSLTSRIRHSILKYRDKKKPER